MKRLIILQPGYLPWIGFFDLMYKADLFVLLDDVQYTSRDWRSRNRIKTPWGVMWLTVPVISRGALNKKIRDVIVDNSQKWRKKHLSSIMHCYKRSSFYNDLFETLNRIYFKNYKFLIDINIDLMMAIRDFLKLETPIAFSSEIPSTGAKDEKLLSICRLMSATHYLSGNAAKGYLRPELFAREKVTVEWHNYQHPFYNQLWTKECGFISHLSIIDLLFNHGSDSLAILSGKKIIPRRDDISEKHADSFV